MSDKKSKNFHPATTTSSLFFLEKLQIWDVTKDYVDLDLTDYKLNHPDIKKLTDKLSPKRLIKTEKCVLWPGHGEGIAIVNGDKYRINYAWRGLSESDMNIGARDYHTVLNWSVRMRRDFKRKSHEKSMDSLVRSIFLDEGGKLEEEMSKGEWYKRIIKCKPANLQGYRRMLEKEAKKYWDNREKYKKTMDEETIKLLDKMQSKEHIEERINSIKEQRIITIKYRPHITEIEPWRIFLRKKRKYSKKKT